MPTSCLVPRCAGWRLLEGTGYSSATPATGITETGCVHEFFCILPARFQTCWACIQNREHLPATLPTYQEKLTVRHEAKGLRQKAVTGWGILKVTSNYAWRGRVFQLGGKVMVPRIKEPMAQPRTPKRHF